MATPYRQGARFEQTVADALERLGWRVVRAAGSKGPVDLIAWLPTATTRPPRRVVAIQCKRNGVIGPGDRMKTLAFASGLTHEAYAVRSHRRRLEVRALDAWNLGWEAFRDTF